MPDASRHWICPFFRGERSPYDARVWVLNPGQADARVTVSWFQDFTGIPLAVRTLTIRPGMSASFSSEGVHEPPPPPRPPGVIVIVRNIEQGWLRVESDQRVLPTGVTAVPSGTTDLFDMSIEHVVPMTFYRG